MQRTVIARWLLIAGLAAIFGYFGIDKFVTPTLWIGWIPPWMDGLLGMESAVWLSLIGAFEILCALLLLIPNRKARQTGALLMAVQILAILPIAGFNDIGLRDFGLMMSAAALWFLL